MDAGSEGAIMVSMMTSLNGEWNLQKSGSREIIPATVPGCVHSDLLAAKKIDDPFVGDNEEKLRWIYKESWIYSREFEVDRGSLNCDRLLLCCDGLDTVAKIYINGKLLAETDNMFRKWEFDVKGVVQPGKNEIRLRFDSPLDYIQGKQKVRKIDYPYAPYQVPSGSLIRKEPCSFGWDWAPCLATCGIWKPICLLAFNTARLGEIMILQDHTSQKNVKLKINVGVEKISSAKLSIRATLAFNGTTVCRELQPVNGNRGEISIDVKNPQLWWPRNMGRQNLYELAVEIFDERGEAIDCKRFRIGLRTLSLIREKDRWGESFYFQVNGVPFFAKGANWIPADAIATRQTPEKYRQLLSSAAEANMNMIRVWGGGFYESDIFYDLCDELGLCVWQDFMFACAPYPLEDKEFVKNAMIEMEQNVSRLRNHACIALWCGNNEIESCGYAAEKADSGHMSLKLYRLFFEKMIPDMLAKLAPQHSYLSGSPYKEAGKHYNPDVWTDNQGRGDAHIWSVWHGRKPFEFYRTCEHRFASEFGFQSFPEPATVSTFTKPTERNITSYVMEHHQRSGIGNTVIMQYMLDWFRMPKDFNSTLWASQILQSLAMKYACEHWRRLMPRSMGALIWQLNDTWPGASWSGIDYFGQWKAMHFSARRFFAPLMVSAVEDLKSGKVQPHVTCDLLEPLKCKLLWKLTNLEGKLLRKGQQYVLAKAGKDTPAAELNFKSELEKNGPRNMLLWLELSGKGQPVSENLVLFARPKHLELPDPQISFNVRATENCGFLVTVESQKPALWVWLEIVGMHLKCSDNFINLEPGKPVQITVSPSKPMKIGQFVRKLKVRSLFNTY